MLEVTFEKKKYKTVRDEIYKEMSTPYVEYMGAYEASPSDMEPKYLLKRFCVSLSEVFFEKRNRMDADFYEASRMGAKVELPLFNKGFVHNGYYCELFLKKEIYGREKFNGLLWEGKEKFFEQLSTTLAEFKKRNIIHGGIFPSNIFCWTENHNKFKLGIGGSEFAFFKGEKPFPLELGDREVKIRSGLFHSPELGKMLRDGAGEIDCRSDVFSLGLLFHWYLAGTLPSASGAYAWNGEGVEVYPWEEESLTLDKRLSPRMAKLIGQMLSKDPDERPCACNEAGSYELRRRLSGMYEDDFCVKERERESEEKPSAHAEEPRKPVEERAPAEIWHSFEEDCPVEGFVWNTGKLQNVKSWRKPAPNEPSQRKGYYFCDRNNFVRFITVDSMAMLKYIVKRENVLASLKEKTYAGDPAIEAYCKEQVRGETRIAGLQAEKTQAEETRKTLVAKAKDYVCRYYLQMKKALEGSLEGEEKEAFSFCEEKLAAFSSDSVEVSPVIEDAYNSLFAALEEVKGLSFDRIPPISVDEERVDGLVAAMESEDGDEKELEILADREFDGEYKLLTLDAEETYGIEDALAVLRNAANFSGTQQPTRRALEEIFEVNAGFKETAEVWAEQVLEKLAKKENISAAIFLKKDREGWDTCMREIAVCNVNLTQIDGKLKGSTELAAKEYWKKNCDKIFEKIINGEIPEASPTLKEQLELARPKEA